MHYPKEILKHLCHEMHQGINTVIDKIEYTDSGVPIIQSKHITKGYLDLSSARYVKYSTYERYKEKYKPRPQDILVCNIGTIGKSILIRDNVDFIIAWNLFILKPKHEIINSTYLQHYLNYIASMSYYTRYLTGGTVKFINKSNMEQIEVPLPHLETQIKIADVLDKAQELIDKRKEQIEKMDEFVQSMFWQMFGDPITNSKGWIQNKFEDYLLAIDSGWSPKCHDHITADGSWGVLKLSAVTGGRFNALENKALPETLTPDLSIEVHSDDLLFTRKNTRELVGACAYVFGTQPKLMIPDIIFRLVTKPSLDKIYLWKLFNNENFKKQIQSLASGSAGSMPNISKSRLLLLQIPVPPLDLQKKFSKIVQKIEQQKLLMQQSLAEMENNFNSLMQKAFR